MILWIFRVFHIFFSITCQNYRSLLKIQYIIHITYSGHIVEEPDNLDFFLFPGGFFFQLKLQESQLNYSLFKF